MRVRLEVRVLHQRDVPGAVEGGADRLLLCTAEGRSPDLQVASAALRECPLPVRVMLRLNDAHTTDGGEFARLVGLAEEYLALGAEGVCFGFLDQDLEVDVATCTALAERIPGVPWTFHEAVDACLDQHRAWRRLLALPGLDAVLSAGSPRGLQVGYDDLLALVQSDERIAARLLPGGGLVPEHVPWLVRAGVDQVHVDVQVRPGSTNRSYVDAGHVRAWRLLLDS